MAYREFMLGRLIALDKQPRVRPVVIGEMWQRLFSKIVLKATGPKATIASQDDKLCAGLKAGINSAVNGVQAIWGKKRTKEDWGFLIVDTNNVFNEINKVGILLMVRHLWPSGARFVFNCYHHWSLLALRNDNGTASFMHSKEGVPQGGPIAMIAYGIGILPHIKNLK